MINGFYLSKECVPHLKKSNHAHILNLSPPLNLNPRWFKDHVAYTMAKYGMSMCVLGMASEFKEDNIAVNAIWPRTAIHTAAIEMLAGKDSSQFSRKPEIMADAAYAILIREPRNCTGNFYVDEDILRESGVTDLKQYNCDPNENNLMLDFFLDEADTQTIISSESGSSSNASTGGAGAKIPGLFQKIEGLLNEELVGKTKSVYQFNVTGAEKGTWFLDLKNGSGKCGQGEAPGAPDATFTMESGNFFAMFTGKIKPTAAFMSGKLKIKGDLQKAMKLEKLMGGLKSKL